MTTVGIREFKIHLSKYLRMVAEGEKILVTNHGKDVAVVQAPSAEHEGLRRLIESGAVKWSGGKPRGHVGPPIVNTGEPISKTVLDLREPK